MVKLSSIIEKGRHIKAIQLMEPLCPRTTGPSEGAGRNRCAPSVAAKS